VKDPDRNREERGLSYAKASENKRKEEKGKRRKDRGLGQGKRTRKED